MDTIAQDKQIIASLGGPTKVVELLGWEKRGGQQRVQNWLSRGIPAAIKVKRPELFMVIADETVAVSAALTQAPQQASHGD